MGSCLPLLRAFGSFPLPFGHSLHGLATGHLSTLALATSHLILCVPTNLPSLKIACSVSPLSPHTEDYSVSPSHLPNPIPPNSTPANLNFGVTSTWTPFLAPMAQWGSCSAFPLQPALWSLSTDRSVSRQIIII